MKWTLSLSNILLLDLAMSNTTTVLPSLLAKGFAGTMSKESTPANKKAIKSADNLINKKIDTVTGKPVTEKTKGRAQTIKLFKVAEYFKNYKAPKKPAGGY
ncbi:MAG: hypothetical protein COB85_04625 [Bacteroidetes bacterium]|nr:MAG: hypothetical protein COB85_04625 [Bacteroidota bacterium]